MSEIKYVLLLELDKGNWEIKCPDLSYFEGLRIIEKFLSVRRFMLQQPGVYLNCSTTDPIEHILSMLGMTKNFPWIRDVLLSSHLLRVTDYDDLFSVIHHD